MEGYYNYAVIIKQYYFSYNKKQTMCRLWGEGENIHFKNSISQPHLLKTFENTLKNMKRFENIKISGFHI